MTAINTLKKWFSNFKKPNQEQFWAWIDSFWHKSEKIPMSSIDGLDRIIEGTASAQQLQNHLSDTHAHKGLFDGKVDKVEGKGLSSNDFTNAYKQQLDTLEDYDIELDESTTELKFKKGNNVVRRISLMFLDDEGTKLVYNRTGKTLELRDKRDNLLTSIPVSHFVSNIPTGIVVQNGKIKLMAGSEVIDENAISYNDLADKPELNYLPLSGGSVNGDINLNGDLLVKDNTKIHVRDNGNIVFGNKPFNDLVIGEFKGIQLWGQGNDKVVLAGGGVKNLSDFDFFKGYIEPDELNVFKPRETGAYAVKYAGGWGTLINFKSIGSTSSLEFFKSNWYPSSRIGVRNSVDSNRFNDDNGTFRYLAWFSDVYREGAKCEGSTTLRVDHQNQVIFVTTTCNIELSDIQNMGSVSFRKVFDGGSVTLSCSGKNIIYTADNQFNGKKGSTAVISIYENDCYIDIRNV